MDIFDKALSKAIQLKIEVNISIKQAFEDNSLVIKDIQVNKQLFDKGEDSHGSVIRPSYKPITISIKKAKGQPFNRVTLKDTGDFHRSIEVIPKDDELEISTSIEYAKWLFKKYGDDVLGIQEEIMKEFIQKYTLVTMKKKFNDIIDKP